MNLQESTEPTRRGREVRRGSQGTVDQHLNWVHTYDVRGYDLKPTNASGRFNPRRLA